MTETMTEVQVPCPSCARPMESINDSWQCLACHPIPVNVPTCKTQKCKRPLTRLGDPWNCWICLNCNDHPDVVNKRKKETEQLERKYVDKTLTKENVREMIKEAMSGVGDIVRETMSEFNLKEEPDIDYPPTRAEINQIAESVKQNAVPMKPETWLQKAKRLGVKTHYDQGGLRKKVDVLADIARLTESSPTGDKEKPSATVEKGA